LEIERLLNEWDENLGVSTSSEALLRGWGIRIEYIIEIMTYENI
jgi:hypothetical protein